jgi:hypothetical protein
MAKSTRSTRKATTGETATAPRPGSRERTAQPLDVPPDGDIRDAIARRAYEIFQARGGQHGYEIEDWLQAERELTGRQDAS